MTEDVSLEEAMIARGAPPDIARTIARDAEAEASSAALTSGAAELVAWAAKSGIPVVIVSNLSREYAEPIRRLLSRIPAALSFEVGHSKPAPEIYQAALTLAGGGGPRPLMVGDSLRCDYDGPRSAGIEAALLSPTPKEGVDIITDMHALLARLSEASGRRT